MDVGVLRRFRPPVLVAGVLVVALVAAGALVPVLRRPTGGFPAAGAAPDAAVVVHGRGGSFGVTGDTLPSGQSLARRAVPGWGQPAGVQGSAVAVTADGTVLTAGRGLDIVGNRPTATDLVIGSYQPAANRSRTLRLRTDKGRDRVRAADGGPAAPSVTALEPVAGGRAVVFTVDAGILGQDLAENGAWPVFGVLTPGDDGWRVAAGDGWVNQFTGRELRGSAAPAGAGACPARPAAAAESDCGRFVDVAALPASGDLIVAQEGGVGPAGESTGSTAGTGAAPAGGGLAAVRVSPPGADGRVSVTVVRHLPVPAARTSDGRPVTLAAETISVDPTSARGDERFVVTWRAVTGEKDPRLPRVIQEFRYDAATGEIRPVSEPLVPGDGFGYNATLFDRHGNLWVTRVDTPTGLTGGSLAVYTRAGGRARLAGCGRPAGVPVGAFATPCRPDYDLLTAAAQRSSHGLIEDPSTGAVLNLTWFGYLQAFRATATGGGLTFEVGNPVDLGRKLLRGRGDDTHVGWLGGFDGRGRLWTSATVLPKQLTEATTDQYLYSVDVRELFDVAPLDLPAAPGRTAVLQAERTVTTTTRPGPPAGTTATVDPDADFLPCDDFAPGSGCGYDDVDGNGYLLGNHTRYGVEGGTAVEYRVRVPVAGRYRLSYRVCTFPQLVDAAIEADAAGQASRTNVWTRGVWLTVDVAKPVDLAAGVHTLRLSAPAGGGGWWLNHVVFQRI